jgi:DNA polymerase-1
VVQASAADWALVLLAALRRGLAAQPRPGGLPAWRWDPQAPHLVFFQHDEVIVHCPAGAAGEVAAAIGAAADEAGRLVFGPTQVRFPVTTAVVTSYADAK